MAWGATGSHLPLHTPQQMDLRRNESKPQVARSRTCARVEHQAHLHAPHSALRMHEQPSVGALKVAIAHTAQLQAPLVAPSMQDQRRLHRTVRAPGDAPQNKKVH